MNIIFNCKYLSELLFEKDYKITNSFVGSMSVYLKNQSNMREREERIELFIYRLEVVTKIFAWKCCPDGKTKLFMKICNKAKDVSSNSTSNGQNAVHCEHANWEYTTCSQNQSDCGICKRLPPHALQKKLIHNFTGNVSTTLLWPVAFYRDYAEFVCCIVHVTKKDLQIKDTLHLILLLNKQNFTFPPLQQQ